MGRDAHQRSRPECRLLRQQFGVEHDRGQTRPRAIEHARSAGDRDHRGHDDFGAVNLDNGSDRLTNSLLSGDRENLPHLTGEGEDRDLVGERMGNCEEQLPVHLEAADAIRAGDEAVHLPLRAHSSLVVVGELDEAPLAERLDSVDRTGVAEGDPVQARVGVARERHLAVGLHQPQGLVTDDRRTSGSQLADGGSDGASDRDTVRVTPCVVREHHAMLVEQGWRDLPSTTPLTQLVAVHIDERCDPALVDADPARGVGLNADELGPPPTFGEQVDARVRAVHISGDEAVSPVGTDLERLEPARHEAGRHRPQTQRDHSCSLSLDRYFYSISKRPKYMINLYRYKVNNILISHYSRCYMPQTRTCYNRPNINGNKYSGTI